SPSATRSWRRTARRSAVRTALRLCRKGSSSPGRICSASRTTAASPAIRSEGPHPLRSTRSSACCTTTAARPTRCRRPTQTPAPGPGAPDGCPPPATDQRGVARRQGPACDLGAVELRAAFVLSTPDEHDFGVRTLADGPTAPVAFTISNDADAERDAENLAID